MLSLEEVLAAFAGAEASFNSLDTNNDGMLSQAELEAGTGGTQPTGCVFNKIGSVVGFENYVSELFLLGVSLLALFAIPYRQDG